MADRILLDANAILNLAFVPDSWSRQSVILALKNGVSVLVGHAVVREAIEAARRTAIELGKKTDPELIIDRSINYFRLLQVSSSSSLIVPKEIPTHDAHVYREANSAKAAILTSDGELWVRCKQAGIEALFPLEIVRQYEGFSLQTTVFGVPMRAESGSVFARGYPSNWGGHVSEGRFTIIDFPGFLWMYYDAGDKHWVAEMDCGKRLTVPTTIYDSSLQTVALSWRAGSQIGLRVAGVRDPCLRTLDAPLSGKPSGPARIGSHRTDKHYWNGAIYVSIFSDRPIGRDTWKLYLRDRDLTPNPFDSDRLRDAIAQRLS